MLFKQAVWCARQRFRFSGILAKMFWTGHPSPSCFPDYPSNNDCTNTSLALQAPALCLSAELAKTKGRTFPCCWEAGAPIPWNPHHQIHHKSSLLRAADACVRFGVGTQRPKASGSLVMCQAHLLSFPPSTSHLKVPFWLLPLQLTVISG